MSCKLGEFTTACALQVRDSEGEVVKEPRLTSDQDSVVLEVQDRYLGKKSVGVEVRDGILVVAAQDRKGFVQHHTSRLSMKSSARGSKMQRETLWRYRVEALGNSKAQVPEEITNHEVQRSIPLQLEPQKRTHRSHRSDALLRTRNTRPTDRR